MKKTLFVLILILLIGIPACGTSTPLPMPDPESATPADTASGPSPIAQAAPTEGMSETPAGNPFPAPSSLRVVYIRDGNLWSWTEESGSVQLTGTGDISTARLSEDGQLLAFMRGREVWTVRMDGTDARLLATLDDGSASLRFAPTGSSLAVSTGDQIDVINLADITSTTVLNYPAIPDGYYPEVNWSPDASGFKTIIPPQNESGQAELLFVFTNGTVASLAKFQMLPPSRSSPFISPDGGYIIYAAKLNDGNESLYLMDSSGATRPYGEPAESIRAYGWMPGSKQFVYGEDHVQRAYLGNVAGAPTEIQVALPSMIRWIDAEYYLALENGDLIFGKLNAGRSKIDSDVQTFDFTP